MYTLNFPLIDPMICLFDITSVKLTSCQKNEKKGTPWHFHSSENLTTRPALLLSQKKYALVVVISFVLCASVGSLLTSNNESAVCHHHENYNVL